MIDTSDETAAEVIGRLRNLIDPELGVNAVDLGLIYDVQIDTCARELRVDMTLTTPGCPLSDHMVQGATNLLTDIPGFDQVDVRLVWDPPWSPDRMTEDARRQINERPGA